MSLESDYLRLPRIIFLHQDVDDKSFVPDEFPFPFLYKCSNDVSSVADVPQHGTVSCLLCPLCSSILSFTTTSPHRFQLFFTITNPNVRFHEAFPNFNI